MATAVSPAPVARPGWGAAGWLLVLAALAVGFAQGPLAVVGGRLTHLPGDRIDGRFNLYVLEHGHRWTRGDTPAGFWDMPIFYPAPRVTAYSDAHLGSLPVYTLLRRAGLSPEAAYQVWFLGPFALNYAAAGWAARHLGGGPVAAATCGYVFAFAVTALQHTSSHSQLGPRFLVPPAVLLAHGFLLAPTVRRLALLAGCLVAQAYLTVYIAYYLGLLVLATAVATLALNRRTLATASLIAGWWRWLLVGLAAAAALAPLAWPHLQVMNDHRHPDPGWLKLFTPTAWAWLLPADVAAAHGWMTRAFPPPADHPALVEQHLFPGWLPLLGLPLAIARPGAAAVFAAGGLLLALVTTRVGGVCLYDPLFHLPGGSSIRVVSRLVLVLLFPAGLALGTLLDEAARGRWTVGVALVGLVIADQAVNPSATAWPTLRTPVAGVNDATDRLVELVRRERPDVRVLAVLPRPGEPTELPESGARQLEIAFAAQRLGVVTVNGQSGYEPHGWWWFRDRAEVERWLTPARCDGLVVVGDATLPWPDD